MLQRFFQRLFDVRPGEGRLVLRAALALFGLIAAHTLLETARDALFLGKLPASRLTFVYGLLAFTSLAAARFNARFVEAFGRRNGLIFTLFGAALGTMYLYMLEPSSWVVFSLYLWTGLLGSILVVQFWMLAGHTFTVSQGKRLFGLLAAGGVCGAVTGAVAATLLLEVVPTRELLVVASSLFLATAFFLTGDKIDDPDPGQENTQTEDTRLGSLALFRNYPYLTKLAGLVAVSTAAVLTTDYLFKSSVAMYLPPEQLGGFFARYYAVLNGVALVVQLFVSSVLLRRLGVLGAFLVLPSLLFVGGAASMVLGGYAILAAKSADGALRHSLHRISTELLWMPLPDRVRNQAKAAIDTVMVRGVQALVAAILLGVATAGFDTPPVLSALVVLFSTIWLALGMSLRRPYLDLFRSALTRNASDRMELDLRSVEIVVESLSSRDSGESLAAIELLAASKRTRLIPALILYHESEEVLQRALEVVPAKDRNDWVPLAERLLEHDSPAVRVAALEAMARNGHYEGVKGRLLDVSPWVRAHAAFWTTKLSKTPPLDSEDVQMLLQMPEKSGIEARVGLLEAIEASGDTHWSNLLLKLATTEEKEVCFAAVQAMTRVFDERFIPLLIERLAIRNARALVRRALVSNGDVALEALEEEFFQRENHGIRPHIPAAIARFASPRAAKILCRALVDERFNGRIRYAVLRALVIMAGQDHGGFADRQLIEERIVHSLQEHFRAIALQVGLREGLNGQAGKESAELLMGLLDDKRRQALDRVFLYLQISFPSEDIRSVENAVKSSNRLKKARAQEFLDALMVSSRVPDLRSLLQVAVDELSDREKLNRVQSAVSLPQMGIDNVLEAMIHDPDEAVSGLASYHVLESGRTKLRATAQAASRERSLTDSLTDVIDRFTGKEVPGIA